MKPDVWSQLKDCGFGDFPGGPAVKMSPSKAGGAGSVPGQTPKIPHSSLPKTKIKHNTEAIL